jgi:hypothetical protein
VNHVNHPAQPLLAAVGLAFLIPLAVAGLTTILLLAHSGPHDLRLAGIPPDELESINVASEREATISREKAIDVARAEVRDTSNGRVRDIGIGRYIDNPIRALSGRLVWVMSFEPDKTAPVFISGGIGRDFSCDWAVHYDHVVAAVDALTGEMLWHGDGASPDLSLPPTNDSPNNSDYAYCERFLTPAIDGG